jgi:hypothetical protein
MSEPEIVEKAEVRYTWLEFMSECFQNSCEKKYIYIKKDESLEPG